ncbi:hypothetical protein SRHO_G00058830 [Serrasalmus rhombeus]
MPLGNWETQNNALITVDLASAHSSPDLNAGSQPSKSCATLTFTFQLPGRLNSHIETDTMAQPALAHSSADWQGREKKDVKIPPLACYKRIRVLYFVTGTAPPSSLLAHILRAALPLLAHCPLSVMTD